MDITKDYLQQEINDLTQKKMALKDQLMVVESYLQQTKKILGRLSNDETSALPRVQKGAKK